MKFSRKVGNGPMNKRFNSGGDIATKVRRALIGGGMHYQMLLDALESSRLKNTSPRGTFARMSECGVIL